MVSDVWCMQSSATQRNFRRRKSFNGRTLRIDNRIHKIQPTIEAEILHAYVRNFTDKYVKERFPKENKVDIFENYRRSVKDKIN
jgi:hypothetical protein